MSTIYGSSVPATNGLASPDLDGAGAGGLYISNSGVAPTAVAPAPPSATTSEGAISQTMDSVAYNKDADRDQATDTDITALPMATEDIIGVAAEGVVDPNARGGGGGGGGGFDVFAAGDELRY